MKNNQLRQAFSILSRREIASVCKVTRQAVTKWVAQQALPRTEYTGETQYAMEIAKLVGEKDLSPELREQMTPERLLGVAVMPIPLLTRRTA